MAEILQGAIAKAQLDHSYSKNIRDNISYHEHDVLLTVIAFLATYGVISTLHKTLPKVEAEEVAQNIKEIAMSIFSSNSGMAKDKWIKMYEYISGKLDVVINNKMQPEQKIIELGTLLLSHACIEREDFAAPLVIECGENGFRVLKTATSETYSQLFEHEFASLWDAQSAKGEGLVAKINIDNYKLALRKALISDIEVFVPDSIKLLLGFLDSREGERLDANKIHYEFLYLTLFSYVNANTALSRDQSPQLLNILEEMAEEILSASLSEEDLCDRMIELNYRLLEYSRGLDELIKNGASHPNQAKYYQLFIERIFGDNHKNDLMIHMMLPVVYGTHREGLIKYFKSIDGIFLNEKQ
jgi:hypothetical protein